MKEGIREGIRDLIDSNYNATNPDYPKLRAFQPEKFLNELLPYLDSKDVMIVSKPPKGNLEGACLVILERLVE